MPCSVPTYHGHTESYNNETTQIFSLFNPSYSDSNGANGDKDQNDKAIFFMYQSTDEIHFTRQRVMTGHNFVSAVGGGLGLFLGFSFYQVMAAAIKSVQARQKKKKDVAEDKPVSTFVP